MMNTEETIANILATVADPEIPVLSIIDLGIVRSIEYDATASKVKLTITPTYSGCPAMKTIEANIYKALKEHGFSNAEITTVLLPPWTTDWMSATAKEKLKQYGIAPPAAKQCVCTPALFWEEESVACPHCGSYNTTLLSRFGSTACKALYQCNDCLEPFDYFKSH